MSARGTLVSLVLRAARPADADDVLLSRFVRERDGIAFEGLVRRYAPLVAGVCRRRLGDGPDADDAFQAAFLVLARDAGKIADPAALPGWLYRVAYLVAGKAFTRRKTDALPDDPADRKAESPEDTAAGKELRMLLDAELAALPEKQRAVAVLCLVEGRTAPDVAAVLGVPVGTVESRLHHARKALQAGLTRKGVTAASAVAALAGGTGSTAAGLDRLISLVTAAVAAGGTVPESISDLVHGVTTMIPIKTKLLAAGVISLGLLGTAAGVFQAAGDKPAAKTDPPAKEAKAEPPAKPKAEAKPAVPNLAATGGAYFQQVLRTLDQPAAKFSADEMTFGHFLEWFNQEFDARVRIGEDEFKVAGIQNLAEAKVKLLKGSDLTAGDLLREAIDQVMPTATVKVVGKQLVVVPGYEPPDQSNGVLDLSFGLGTRTDPAVLYSAVDKPLVEVLEDLRRQTGATIVLDARCKDHATHSVSGTFNAVRLATVLHLLGDMCELAVVPVGQTFYLTTPSNASVMRQSAAEAAPAPPKQEKAK